MNYIMNNSWFNKDFGEDLKPYPGNTSKEPRWKTLFAWARNDAADHDYIIRGHDGLWPISTHGKEELERQKAFLCGNEFRLRLMFLAKQGFKNYIWPGYQASKDDLKRPPSIYEDSGKYVPHDVVRLLTQIL